MPQSDLINNLPIPETVLFMPCPYCQQGDHFQVLTIAGIKVFYCHEFSCFYLSAKYDKFIRSPEITIDYFDLTIVRNVFEKVEAIN